jgi:L-amino acid N-acyltransferase YncA
MACVAPVSVLSAVPLQGLSFLVWASQKARRSARLVAQRSVSLRRTVSAAGIAIAVDANIISIATATAFTVKRQAAVPGARTLSK